MESQSSEQSTPYPYIVEPHNLYMVIKPYQDSDIEITSESISADPNNKYDLCGDCKIVNFDEEDVNKYPIIIFNDNKAPYTGLNWSDNIVKENLTCDMVCGTGEFIYDITDSKLEVISTTYNLLNVKNGNKINRNITIPVINPMTSMSQPPGKINKKPNAINSITVDDLTQEEGGPGKKITIDSDDLDMPDFGDDFDYTDITLYISGVRIGGKYYSCPYHYGFYGKITETSSGEEIVFDDDISFKIYSDDLRNIAIGTQIEIFYHLTIFEPTGTIGYYTLPEYSLNYIYSGRSSGSGEIVIPGLSYLFVELKEGSNRLIINAGYKSETKIEGNPVLKFCGSGEYNILDESDNVIAIASLDNNTYDGIGEVSSDRMQVEFRFYGEGPLYIYNSQGNLESMRKLRTKNLQKQITYSYSENSGNTKKFEYNVNEIPMYYLGSGESSV